MTDTPTSRFTPRNRAGTHPASDARRISAAIAATLSFGGIAVLGVADAMAKQQASAQGSVGPSTDSAFAPTPIDPIVVTAPQQLEAPTVAPTVPPTVAPRVIVVRRVHHLPAAAAPAAARAVANTPTRIAAPAAKPRATPAIAARTRAKKWTPAPARRKAAAPAPRRQRTVRTKSS
jgi:hypothetical protein